jgi:hypothetical protein
VLRGSVWSVAFINDMVGAFFPLFDHPMLRLAHSQVLGFNLYLGPEMGPGKSLMGQRVLLGASVKIPLPSLMSQLQWVMGQLQPDLHIDMLPGTLQLVDSLLKLGFNLYLHKGALHKGPSGKLLRYHYLIFAQCSIHLII